MQRVMAQVVWAGTGNTVLVDRTIGSRNAEGTLVYPTEIAIAGKTFGVDGCSLSDQHEVWHEPKSKDAKPLPGWQMGFKLTLTSPGVFSVGDKVTVEESVPDFSEQEVMGNVAPPPAIPPEAETTPAGA